MTANAKRLCAQAGCSATIGEMDSATLSSAPAPHSTPSWAQYILALFVAILVSVVAYSTGFLRDYWSFGASVFLSLAAGFARSQIERTAPGRAILYILAGTMVLFLALSVMRYFNLPPRSVSGVIVYPTERDRIPFQIEVRGSHDHSDCSLSMWVVVKTGEPKHYFQKAICRSDNTWDTPPIQVGEETLGVGCRYSMSIAVAPPNMELQLQGYQDKLNGPAEWPPGLIKIGKETTVTRAGGPCVSRKAPLRCPSLTHVA